MDTRYIHLEDLAVYFRHSLDCNIHFIIPTAIVFGLLFAMVFVRGRRTGVYTLSRRWIATFSILFFILWIIDIPAAVGRCPDFETTPPGETVETLYDPLGFVFGFSAGLITFLSPCGLPPLPAYISYFIGARASKERGIGLGTIATSGFILAIAVVGTTILLVRNFFVTSYSNIGGQILYLIDPLYLELLEFIAGSAALGIGVLMLIGVRLPFFRTAGRASGKRGTHALFLFSIGWGTAAILCAPYVLFPVLLYAVGRGGPEPFIGYALGMALPVLAVSTLLGAGKGSTVSKLVKFIPKLHKLSGLILIGMGVYVIQYTYFNLSPLFSYVFSGT
ncbi:MAG: cytochrome c biogenesis CcdA family protein [Candidatus Bathyarchaeia archaeon]